MDGTDGMSFILDKNCLIHTFWFIRGIKSQWIIRQQWLFFQFHICIAGWRWQKCRFASPGQQGSEVPGSVSTWLNTKICFNTASFCFSISPSAFPPFCLCYSRLCSSSSLSQTFCADVSPVTTLLCGAPPVVIVWVLIIPILNIVSFCYWDRNTAHRVLSPALLLLWHQLNNASVSPLWTKIIRALAVLR